MTMAQIIDVTVIAMLVLACGYGAVLSRRLKTLRDGQVELFQMIEKFDAASKRAERNLAAIQQNQALVGKRLSALTGAAQSAIDELSVMVNSGDHIASRIEQSVNSIRTVGLDPKSRRKMAS